MTGTLRTGIGGTLIQEYALLLVVSPQFNANAIQDYALRWEIETLFSCLKGRGEPYRVYRRLFYLS